MRYIRLIMTAHKKTSKTPWLQYAAASVALCAALSAWIFLPQKSLTVVVPEGLSARSVTVTTHPNRYSFPLKARWLDGKAAKAMNRGSFGAAEELFSKSLQGFAKNPRALTGRGSARIALKRLDDAAADYQAAVNLEPAIVEVIGPAMSHAFFLRGRAAISRKDLPAAERDLKRAVALDAGNAPALIELASLDILRRNYRGCAAKLDKALAISPDSADAYANRGACRSALGRHKDALADLDQAINRGRATAETFGTRAGVKVWMKDYAGAITDAEKAISLDKRLAPTLKPLIDLARNKVAR
jgi:tetratricopeptide (TPR) repeat protein